MIDYQPYRKKKNQFGRSILFILLAILLVFLVSSNFFAIRSVVQSIVYPFQYAAVTSWKAVTGFPSAVSNIRSLSNENGVLKQEVKLLQAQLLILNEKLVENERLNQVLRFKQKYPRGLRLLPAKIIGKSPAPWFPTLIIDQGSRAGVIKDMPAIVESGLVGRVVEVSLLSSKVMLISDIESSVAAVNSRSRDFGLVSGGVIDKLFMKYVSAGVDIRVGDKIVTSRISTVFPTGIPIGTINLANKREHDLFYHIEITPAVDFSKLEEIFLVL